MNWQKMNPPRLNLKLRILGGFSLVVAMTTALGLFVNLEMKGIGHELKTLSHEYMPLTETLHDMQTTQLNQEIHMHRAIQFAVHNNADNKYRIQIEKTAFFSLTEDFNKIAKKSAVIVLAIESATNRKSTKSSLVNLGDRLQQIKHHHDAFQTNVADTIALLEKGRIKRALNSETQLDNASQQLDKEIKTLLVDIQEASADRVQHVESREDHAKQTTIIIVFLVILLGLSIGYVVTRRIVVPIQIAVERARQIASGNLSASPITMNLNDEVGDLLITLNEMTGNLRKHMSLIAKTSTDVSAAALKLSNTSEEMASGANEQTSQTSQVATSVEEMSATVQQVAKNAGSASESAKKSGETANKGGVIVKDTIQGMTRISSSVQDLQNVIQSLSNNSAQIGNIIGVIDDVADQTNLLALNAAIEAARAGEQGRGFAVVADEVRKLAERTSSSTKEIADMVKNIQEGTSQAVTSMEKGAAEVEVGVGLAGQAGMSLEEIVSGVQTVQDMVQQIATASEEQSAAAEEIASNIDSIASVSKQNAGNSNETSQAAGHLSQLGHDLQNLVNKFQLSNDTVPESPQTHGSAQETASEAVKKAA